MQAQRSTHIVFSTGCTPYFDWQSLGLAHSHASVRQYGKITRLVSQCADDAARARSLQLPHMSTHEHPDFGVPAGNGVDDVYPQYNKPAGIVHWLAARAAHKASTAGGAAAHTSADRHPRRGTPRRAADEADFVLLLESDMLMRAPIDCGALGVRPGRAASARYEYLKGASNGMARQFVKNVHLVQPVGGWVCLHKDDLARVAPLWLDLAKQVRARQGNKAFLDHTTTHSTLAT